MPEINPQWGSCIKQLLAKHDLSTRGAMLKVGGSPSHTTIRDWADGIVPKYTELVYRFLSHFPREEAIECLEAGGYPVPAEWESADPVERVKLSLRATRLLPETEARLREVIDQIEAERGNQNGGNSQ